MNAKLTYGIRDNEIISIDDVKSGLSCNVNCALCNDKLVAKKGLKTAHHFAHYKVENCKGSVETSLHLLAKEILNETREIKLPKVELEIGEGRNQYLFFEAHRIKFDRVIVEKTLGEIIPDLLCYVNEKPLLIEIAVTHFIDEYKRKKIKAADISAIEIDLSEFKAGISKKQLKDFLINKAEKKKWIYNKRLRRINNEIMRERNKVIEELHFEGSFTTRRWHMNCPISKNGFASYMDDCSYCLYNVQINRDFIAGGQISVICSGKNSKNINNRIKELGGMPISNI
jgi:hypothetical protein